MDVCDAPDIARFFSGNRPEKVANLEDAALLTAYQRFTGEPGDPAADALLAEIARRGLDV